MGGCVNGRRSENGDVGDCGQGGGTGKVGDYWGGSGVSTCVTGLSHFCHGLPQHRHSFVGFYSENGDVGVCGQGGGYGKGQGLLGRQWGEHLFLVFVGFC